MKVMQDFLPSTVWGGGACDESPNIKTYCIALVGSDRNKQFHVVAYHTTAKCHGVIQRYADIYKVE